MGRRSAAEGLLTKELWTLAVRAGLTQVSARSRKGP